MTTRYCPCWLLVLAATPLLSGCAAMSPRNIQPEPREFAAPPATVFIADGAGNFQSCSRAFQSIAQADGYPFEVITYEWSHGYRQIRRDHIDYPHARCEGKKLAAVIEEYHAAHPDRPIYLIAHSAGSAVVLAALEQGPPGIVDRAVLLGPSLSTFYDTRPALRSVKESVHVFYSTHDTVVLGMMTRLVGTADRRRTATSGRVGFAPFVDPDEPDLLSKLVQRPWSHSDRQLGNDGGHYGAYQPAFVRAHILPLLQLKTSADLDTVE